MSALSAIEREAFPTQWPPTRFTRELRRSNTDYLVAVRDWPDAPRDGPAAGSNRPLPPLAEACAAAEQKPGVLGRLLRGIREVFWTPPGLMPAPWSFDLVVGYVGMWFVASEAHVVSIAVRRSERRRGVGELLIVGAIQSAREHGSRELTLEVRSSNHPAQLLYRKYGFRESGVRNHYYVDNGEDAIIMTTPPIASREYADLVDSLARDHAERWGYGGRMAVRSR